MFQTFSWQRLMRRFAVGFMISMLALLIVGGTASLGTPQVTVEAQEATEAVVAEEPAAPPAPVSTIRDEQTTMLERVWCFGGLFGLIGISFLLSNNRKQVPWRLVAIGTALQIAFAVLILKTPFGGPVFAATGEVFGRLLGFTSAGANLLFGFNPSFLATFAFGVLPTIIFFSSLMAVLYYIGVMQWVVRQVAWAMRKTMKTSGSETLSAAANIFVGQTEAPLLIKPYVATMTQSELMAVMVGGFATVAGGVMAMYIAMLTPFFPDIAGHLLAASVMSAPAALVTAKIMHPETEVSPTAGEVKIEVPQTDANVIDAAARGASEGMQLAINVAAMLLAFVALIAMVNFIFAMPSYVQHGMALQAYVADLMAAGVTLPTDLASCGADLSAVPMEARAACLAELQAAFPEVQAGSTWGVFTLERLMGFLFAPLALMMGVPWSDCLYVGELLGSKTVLNEFIAYQRLSVLVTDPVAQLHQRSVVIASYALCGFANFASIAIQLGGIGSIAPERREDLARLGMRAMIGGSIAGFMTACIAGALL
jgi:CNT family concentrative nucleoside transporter